MARRASAADLTEDDFASGFSGVLGDYVEEHGNIDDGNDDDIAGNSDYSDYSLNSLGVLAALIGAEIAQSSDFGDSNQDDNHIDEHNDGYVDEHNDEYIDEDLDERLGEDLAYLIGEYDNQHDNSTPPPPNLAVSTHSHSHPVPASSQSGSQDETRSLQSQPLRSAASAARLPLGFSLDNEDSAINIEDDDDDNDDDGLEYLGQTDFSSPSIFNDNNAALLHSSPAQRNRATTLYPDVDAMPQTRRRAAEVRATSVVANPFPIPLPADAAAQTVSSNTTLGRPRTRSGSNSPTSPRISALASASRTSHKRRRSGDAGPSGTTLPPIADLLATVGNTSSSSSSQQVDSQASSSSSSSGGSSAANRPRISPKRPRRHEAIILDDDLFGSDDDGDAGMQMVNLVDVDRPQAAKAEVGEGDASEKDQAATAAPAPEPKKTLIRLSAQQCVICMDNMTNLTTTHCGHIFCGECLHSSLSMDSTRRICPICRTKVEMRVPNMSATRLARSVFPLQLKMRARNQKGKELDSSY